MDSVDYAARRLTLKGTKNVVVAQEDGHWPPFASVQASRSVHRDPRILTAVQDYSYDKPDELARFSPPTYTDSDGIERHLIWCKDCDTWQRPTAFSPDKRAYNGLKSSCRTCRNRRGREDYAEAGAVAN